MCDSSPQLLVRLPLHVCTYRNVIEDSRQQAGTNIMGWSVRLWPEG